jgi:hypothetical protein
VGRAYAAQTLAALRGGELTNTQRITQLWQVVASTPWSIAPSVDASGRPWLSVVMGIPAMRLLFSYDGEEVTLTSQQRLEMALPASDLQEPQDRAGFWAEVRDADGEVLDHRAMPDPLRTDVEVFSPGETPRWVALDRPQGAFTVVVADHLEADHVALVANDTAAIRARFTSPGPHEIGRFALEPHPGEDT